LFSNDGKISAWQATADATQTRALFERLFTAGDIPDLKSFPDFKDMKFEDLLA
jgi:hypothetical protein